MNRYAWIGFAGIVMLATAILPARAEMEHVKVAIPSQIVNFAAEFIAEDLYYKDQGLEVQSLAIPGIGAMNAVLSSERVQDAARL